MDVPPPLRTIKAMPLPPEEEKEKEVDESPKRKRHSDPSIHLSHPHPILPKPFSLTDQPLRIISPTMPNSQSLNDSWLTTELYNPPFSYNPLGMDGDTYQQPFWMNKPNQNPPQEEEERQSSNHSLSNLPLEMMNEDVLFGQF